uniref:DNA-directed RNA polymerase n=1 Tax=Chaetophora sp. FACHB-2423 TaxID=2725789 RepID=A0A6H1XDY4_9CHLO|nr:beta subunit of RNA polymerase [Chaetophora sp. FACHB-2423]
MSISQSLNIIPIDYSLQTYQRSNQDTSMFHRPVVKEGEWVQAGDLLSDCSSSIGGEFSIGQNILIAYLPWEGYNYEDAILISERLVYDDLYTSIHIERYDISTEKNPYGSETITKDIVLLKDTTELNHLDKNGIAQLGSWLKEGDILVGKITPIESKKQVARYVQLYNDILGKKVNSSMRDTSLRVPRGLEAKVIKVKTFRDKKNATKNWQKEESFSPFLVSNKINLKSKALAFSVQNFLSKNPLTKKRNRRLKSKQGEQKAKLICSLDWKKKSPFFFVFKNGIFKKLRPSFFDQKQLDGKKEANGEIDSINGASAPFIIGETTNGFNSFKWASKGQNNFTRLSTSALSLRLPFFLGKTGGHYSLATSFAFNLPRGVNSLTPRITPRDGEAKLSTFPSRGVMRGLPKNKNVDALLKQSSISSVHIYLAEKRKVQVGDKMAGRHGNKGIISQILPRQDMPYLPDGTPIDMALNPLGVPSRMNVGQIYECLLGLAGKHLGEQYRLQPFDEAFGPEASRSFVFSKLYSAKSKTGQSWLFQPTNPGKLKLFDGRTGNCFDQAITTGYSYMIKLVHLVDEKIHCLTFDHEVLTTENSRSSGPYSLITQQPLKGRSKHGGQRLGEMEVWAIEAYGAAFTLLELLTIKSDDVTGRLTIWDYVLYKKPLYIGTPASFKVLICELQALCLDIGIYKADKSNILKQINVSNMG